MTKHIELSQAALWVGVLDPQTSLIIETKTRLTTVRVTSMSRLQAYTVNGTLVIERLD